MVLVAGDEIADDLPVRLPCPYAVLGVEGLDALTAEGAPPPNFRLMPTAAVSSMTTTPSASHWRIISSEYG